MNEEDNQDQARRSLPNELSDTPATERQVLVEMLDYYRAVFARKVEGLSAEQLGRTTGASEMTLAGLTKHLAVVDDAWFTDTFAGRGLPEPWKSAPWDDDRDWEWHTAVDDDPADLIALFDTACERSRAVIDAAASLDVVSAKDPSGRGPWNLRWILVHMIEEYARHCGHADYLREAIDGNTGD